MEMFNKYCIKDTKSSPDREMVYILYRERVAQSHQMEELHSAITGITDDYILADHARYLQLPANLWFKRTSETREQHIHGVQRL